MLLADPPYAFPRNLVLAASAGTGKTHALVGVVVNLLVGDREPRREGGPAGPVDPTRIVATTFSRRAAAEIRARVTQELERLAIDPATSHYVRVLRTSGRGGRSLSDDAIRVRAGRALARLPGARFGTLHSFATGIVRAHAVELGLGPGFELAADVDSRARADDAVARALELRIATEPRELRALAEAAGGVDRLVVQLRRTLVQLEEDGRPARELAIASGDAKAIEATMTELVEHARALSSSPKFEEAARQLVSAWERGDGAAIERAATALCAVDARGKKTPELEAFAVFRKGLAGATIDEKGRRLARAFLMRGRFAEHARIVRDVLATAEEEIQRSSRGSASIGFGEILRAARELLRDRPDVAAAVGDGIDALLVDEFQDTSRVQRDLIQLLWAKDEAREAGRVPPLGAVRESGLLVVGDRKQSIYGFRGADVGVFAELAVGLAGIPAREALGIPAGVTWEPPVPLADFCALRHNRRSEAAVLAFANVFSARRFRPGDPPPALFEIEYVPSTEDLVVPPEREAEAREPAASAPAVTWLRVQPKTHASSRLEEALVIAQRVAALRAAGKAAYRDIAVLATTNGMLDAAAFALAQAEIPYVVAGKSFFKTREVRDLAAMLALVLEPTDRLAALEVLRGPWVSVHDETLLGLTRPGDGLAAPYAWTEPPRPELVHDEDRGALAETAALVAALSRCAGRLGPGAILREAVRGLALEQVLSRLPRGEQRVANMRKLLAIADRHVDPRAFRAWLDDASEQEVAESEAATFSEDDDAVRLLTVHASKGLDFPVVFVPEIGAALPRVDKGAARIALGTGDEPNTLAVRIADDVGIVVEPPSFARAHANTRRRERAERQRLAYVAITRAARAMYLVGGRTREGGGDLGATSIAALEEIAADTGLAAAAKLLVEDVSVPAPSVRAEGPGETAPGETAPDLAPSREAREPREPDEGVSPGTPRPARSVPEWRSLPIAPTALADFDHCPRRFELVHLLGLPERVRGARTGDAAGAAERASRAAAGALDARTQGTLAHAVLERVPVSAFSGKETGAAASAALVAEGVPVDHPQHAAIAARVVRFLSGGYAKTASMGARILREVPFVLPIVDAGGRSLVLRGSMDLVVAWEDGSVDVVDYKSARGGGEDAYAFQLDVYALAARQMYPSARRLRAGLVYLGGAAGAEPTWRALPSEDEVRARVVRLASRLVEARWTESFPRVNLDRCEAIYCGFIGRCHPASISAPAENGTEAKPSRATTT